MDAHRCSQPKCGADDVNARGGLLGRRVELVFYDDQSMGANVPGIYTKLLDVDKVDLVVSGYGTAIIAPAMPVVMQHGAAFVTLLGSATNAEFKYDRCANVSPVGGKMEEDFAKGFFEIAKGITPRPKTVSIAGLDSDFPMRAMQSARTQAGAAGLSIVYDSAYPPSTVDYSPIIRAIQAAKPDLVFFASYPQFDRIAEGRPGIEADRDDAWRRHDWSSGHGHQTATGRIAQQSRLLGCLCARAYHEFPWNCLVPGSLPSGGGGAKGGNPRALCPSTRLCPNAGS